LNILIIGEWYSSNLGDGIICQNVKKLIEEAYKRKDLVIDKADISCRDSFMNETAIIEHKKTKLYLKKILYKSEYLTYKLQDLKRKMKIKKICKKKYDIAIFAGGHLIMPYFTFQICDYIKYLSENKTKIIINACGVGKFKSKILKQKIKVALKNPNIIAISSRDDIEKLKKEYISEERSSIIKKTYDPAIYTDETYRISRKENSQVIGLGIMKLLNVSDEEVIKFWKGVIKQLETQGQKWQFFCNGALEDYRLACRCLKDIKNNKYDKKVYIASRPNRPEELVKIISKYKSLISFRLHSHIVAYSLEIPTVAIVWDDKVKTFFEDLRLKDRCFDIDEKPEKIVEKLLEIKDVDYNQKLKKRQKEIIINNLKENLEEESNFIDNSKTTNVTK